MNSEPCKKCGFYEAAHECTRKQLALLDDEPGPCSYFVSIYKHKRNCPTQQANWKGGSCYGDCKTFIAAAKKEAEARAKIPINHDVWVLVRTNYGVFPVNIGG